MQNYETATRLPFLGISFFLRPEKKQGLKRIIYLVLCIKGVVVHVSTRTACLGENWDSTKAIGEGEKEINKKLSKVKVDITNIYNSLAQYAPKQITSRRIADVYLGRTTIINPNKEISIEEKTIIEILLDHLEKKKANKSLAEGGYKNEKTAINTIKRFFAYKSVENISYTELTFSLAEDLVDWLRTGQNGTHRNCKNTYLKFHFIVLMAGNKYALEEGYTLKMQTKKIKFKDDRTETQSLTLAELKELQKFDFSENIAFDEVRDIFVVLSYTGFQWCDLKKFTQKNIITNAKGKEFISKKRNKTGVVQMIPLFPPVKKVLEKYGYILPVGLERTHNKNIQQIIDLLEIGKNVTNRCGRKTAGMILLNSGVKIQIVSKILGHKNISTTERYYASVTNDAICDATNGLFEDLQLPANEPAKHELKSLSEQIEPQTPANLSANIPADFSKLVELLANAVAQKIKVA